MSNRPITAMCVGGPYAGNHIDVRFGRGGRTSIFSAKGMCGCYVLETVTNKPKLIWCPLEGPTNGTAL